VYLIHLVGGRGGWIVSSDKTRLLKMNPFTMYKIFKQTPLTVLFYYVPIQLLSLYSHILLVFVADFEMSVTVPILGLRMILER
jgi:hypothetical protein